MNQTLLSAGQRQRCQQLSRQSSTDGQRAKALLALDQGATQAQAAEQAGLSLGQVRYCLRRFRTVGEALFESTAPAKASPAAPKATAKPAEKKKTATAGKTKKSEGGKKKNKDKKADKKADKKDKKSDKKKTKGKGKDKKKGKGKGKKK
ncbi:hypothetical protein A11A3_15027 [Alcanivorax hongdengensis A-11-3]|uniref:Uncharacterized protein n=1 Tax=Alcanivorax hongdengensis A-11-3 TaxID=1177179 RepID=L0W8E7_9GAMM|nr:helix-turn-helix domain-containing protein [Alcanivorax hongdengensis]EKF73196.1 hypothetical protein A11A3_15027 [Alcanivorax hongdengensis A-11-3]